MDKARDHCGVFGVYNHPDAARLTYFGLHALQHRGQESAGIVTSVYDERKGRKVMPVVKDFGLVLDVFDDEAAFEHTLLGDAAIGHTRYSTSGSATNPANVQPFVVHDREGHFALAHNGNLSNARSIRERLVEKGHALLARRRTPSSSSTSRPRAGPRGRSPGSSTPSTSAGGRSRSSSSPTTR